jgi:hypothetical protein
MLDIPFDVGLFIRSSTPVGSVNLAFFIDHDRGRECLDITKDREGVIITYEDGVFDAELLNL